MSSITEHFLEYFDSSIEKLEDRLPLGGVRAIARKRFAEEGFPHRKMEKWRNTSLRSIKEYIRSQESDYPKIDKSEWPSRFQDAPVLVNGKMEDASYWEEAENGVQVGSLRIAIQRYPDLVKSYFNKNNKEELYGTFALNTMLASDGLWVYVPKGVQLEEPIIAVQYTSGISPAVFQLRNIFIVENGAEAEVQILQTSDMSDHHFIQDITECFVGDRAILRRHVLQQFQGETIAFSTAFSAQGAASEYISNVCTLKSFQTRNEQHVLFQEPGSVARLGGLYISAKKERVENQVFIDHAVPECDSHENFAGVLSEDAQGAFTGHILVREDAQKTNAFQASNNMVLSDTARVRSLPFLEIYADDVKCSHGATVGKLNDEALFYLRSRGINEKEARNILLTSFAAGTLENIQDEPYKQLLIDELQSKLSEINV